MTEEERKAYVAETPAPVVPKVKPLVWEDGKFKHRNGNTYTKRAYSSHGPYYANEDGWCGPGISVEYVTAGTDVIDYVNQIHEARILSQIDMAPVTLQEGGFSTGVPDHDNSVLLAFKWSGGVEFCVAQRWYIDDHGEKVWVDTFDRDKVCEDDEVVGWWGLDAFEEQALRVVAEQDNEEVTDD